MSAFDYQLSTITKYRSGQIGDEYIDVTQSDKIINQRIVLNEIPVFLNKVQISGMSEVLEGDTADLTSTQYRVDYNEGLAFFHASQEGATKTCIFKGRGNHFISATRIYTAADASNNVTQTLDAVVAAASQFIFIGDYDNATIYKTYNFVNFQGASFLYINSTSLSGHLPSDPIYWARISGSLYRGQYSNAISYNSGDVISDSNNYKMYQSIVSGNLNNPLSDATKWQLQIDVSGIVNTLNTTNTNVQNAESLRVTSEGNRVSAETGRTNAESGRVTAEGNRVSGENSRISSESSRSGSETTRQNQEITRQTQESARETNTTNAINNLNTSVSNVSHKGAYNASTSYVKNNSVSLSGNTWRCLQNSTGNSPVEGIYWTLEASKGADGLGSGSVTNVSSSNTDLSITNPTSTPVITINTGSGANQILKRDSNAEADGLIFYGTTPPTNTKMLWIDNS